MVLGFLVRSAFQHELDPVAVALAICASCLGTGSSAPNEADVLDRTTQTMQHHWIGPVDEGVDAILAPHEPACIAFLRRLQHEAHASIVALALHAVQATALALKPDL